MAQGAKAKSCSTKAAKLDTLACALYEKVSDHVVLSAGLCFPHCKVPKILSNLPEMQHQATHAQQLLKVTRGIQEESYAF